MRGERRGLVRRVVRGEEKSGEMRGERRGLVRRVVRGVVRGEEKSGERRGERIFTDEKHFHLKTNFGMD